MDQPKIKYRPLTRTTRKMFSLVNVGYRLWSVDDHLLQQESRGYSESCKRFYFQDIQAIVITRTKAGRKLNIILGFLGLVFIMLDLIFFSYGSEEIGDFWRVNGAMIALTAGPIAGIFSGAIAVNLILGPTCKTRIYTAVQAEDLVSLSRLRTAQKVVAVLKPLIEAAQGRFNPESLETSAAETASVTPAASAGAAAPLPFARPAQPEPEVRHEPGNFHAAFFGMNLIFAASALIDIFWQHHVKNTIDGLMLLPFVALAVVALLKQRHSDLPQSIKVMPWLCLGFLVLTLFFMVAYAPIYILSHPEVLKSGSMPERLEGPVFLVYLSIESVVYSALGLIGLLRVNRFQLAHAAGTGAANAS